MSLEDALQFIRETDNTEWNLLIREMGATRKRRDLESAQKLSIGAWRFLTHLTQKTAGRAKLSKLRAGG